MASIKLVEPVQSNHKEGLNPYERESSGLSRDPNDPKLAELELPDPSDEGRQAGVRRRDEEVDGRRQLQEAALGVSRP